VWFLKYCRLLRHGHGDVSLTHRSSLPPLISQWSDAQLEAEYDKTTGFILLLRDEGISKVKSVISKNVSKNNIQRLAAMRCSNASENFWMCATVHSEEKRLNLMFGVVG